MSQKSKIAIYIVEDEKSAQYRYRVKNVMDAVKNGKDWDARCYLRSEIDEEVLLRADLVVILRQTAKDNKLLDLIRQMQAGGVKVLFDLDDLIFDFRDLLVLMWSTNSRNVLYWVGYVWGIRRIAKKVDGFICTNDFLGKKLERSFGKPYKVIRNSLNSEQVEISEKCLKEKSQRGERDGFLIGYFSGSPTHAKDFAMVEDELIRFLRSHNDAKLLVVGRMKFSKKMQGMIDEERVIVEGLVDYLRLQELIAKVDVNIAPLLINDFTNCKSELKFFEAGAVETTTIASPSYTFKKAISDGENGYLAKPGEWYGKLEYLYKHPEENRKVALAAKKYAMKHYYGKEFLKEVEEAYDYLAK